MARLSSGDREAFAELVRQHRDRMWAVALRVTGDPEEAADALQDAFIEIYRRSASFSGDVRVTTWLHRLVVNAALDRIRRKALRSPPAADLEVYDLTDPGPPPIDELELRLDVGPALEQLAPDRRAVVTLVYMQGFSVAEASQLLGVSETTVRRRLRAGREDLRQLLGHLRPGTDPPDALALQPAPSTTAAQRSRLDKIRSLLVRFRGISKTPEDIAHTSAAHLNASLEGLFLRLGPPPDDLVANNGGNGGIAGE